MHSYDAQGRQWVYIAIALLSVPPVWMVAFALAFMGVVPAWWMTTPSFGAFYTISYWLFDHHVWRFKSLHRLGLVNIPDLNGRWIGEVDSSFGNGGSMRPVSLSITQTWSRITIRLDSDHSSSHSEAGAIRNLDLDTPELVYMYWNEPKSHAADSMEAHRGTVILKLSGKVLIGQYYTGRGRREIGMIKVARAKASTSEGDIMRRYIGQRHEGASSFPFRAFFYPADTSRHCTDQTLQENA